MSFSHLTIRLVAIIGIIFMFLTIPVHAATEFHSFNPESWVNTERVTISINGIGFKSVTISNVVLESPDSVITPSTFTVESDTKITARFNLAATTVGPYDIVLITSTGQVRSITPFRICYPFYPVISSISPDSIRVEDGRQDLIVRGNNFTLLSTSRFVSSSGTIIPVFTTSHDGVNLTLDFTPENGQGGIYTVEVMNDDGQRSSDAVYLRIYDLPPRVNSVLPDTWTTVDPDCILTILGSYFREGCTIRLTNTDSGASITNTTQTSVSPDGTTCAGEIELAEAEPGEYYLSITNPDGQESVETVIFTLLNTKPSVQSVTPNEVQVSESPVNIVVQGERFTEGCTIRLTNTDSGASITNTTQTAVSDDGKTCSGEIELSEAEPGEYMLSIINPEGEESEDSIMFTILPSETLEYTIHITSGPGGKTSPTGAVTAQEDTNLMIKFLPDSGYAVWDIIVDGIGAGNKPTYQLSDINENHFIHADFYLEKPHRCPTAIPTPVITPNPILSEYYVHARSDYGSYIVPEGEIRIPAGSSMTFTIGVKEGFHLADILVNERTVGLISQVTLREINNNQTIRVTSERNITSHLSYFDVIHHDIESKTVQLNSTSYPDVPWEFWNFGDGSTSFGRDSSHTYDKPGTYTIDHQIVFRNGSSRCTREVEIKG